MANHVAAIKALVVNSVEGLPYDNVTVTLFPADPWPFAAEKPKDTVGASLVRNAWFFPAMTASGVLILFAGILSMWRRRSVFNDAAAAFKRRVNQPSANDQAPSNLR